MKGLGTLIDAGVIIVTGVAGLMVGRKINKDLRVSLNQVLGLLAMVVGVLMIVEGKELLILFVSLIVGLMIGEASSLSDKLEKLTMKFKGGMVKSLVLASLLSLVGPLAIVGPIQEGLGRGYELLVYKASLDGITTFLLSSVMGVGAVLAVIPVVIVQGSITMLASAYSGLFTERLLSGLISLGGVMLLAVGLDLLEVKKFKVVNMLPGFLVVPVVVLILSLFGGI